MSVSDQKPSVRILRNSIWYGLETVIEIVVFFASSIAVARYLGPEKLGHFSYINFFVVVLTQTAGQGVSVATRKYMMEFMAQGRLGTARAVYRLAYRYQLIGAISISTLSILLVVLFGDPSYKAMAIILLASIVPGLMSWVPAQANAAFEDLRPNTFSAFGYLISYALVIAATIYFRWDLIGIASATLVGRTVEVILRTGPVRRRLSVLPLDVLEPELIQRIRRFSVQGIGLQLLTTVVWDRSELIFLKYFSTAAQMAFYSVSFTFTSNLLTAARVLSGAASISLMGESGRDSDRTRQLAWSTCRFLLLMSVPVSLGAAAVTFSGIQMAYGGRYLPAVPVLITAVLLGIPRIFQGVPETLLRSADRQDVIIYWYCVTAVFNGLVDWILIPRYAALGAAWGNGLGQAFGVVVIWMACSRVIRLNFPWMAALRIGGASVVMAALAYFISHHVPGAPGFFLAVLSGCVIYPVLLRLFRALEPHDRERLALIGNRLPRAITPAFEAVIAFMTPASA
ncbi:Membrane protein involved in the export of O-antigen and teichoic acid [Bryocella elongata]|uniref:Membrane protein involved in the export of O-antigen and teichoic acid n=1 Tax=Bryocella elongata TaxID=863522 RepID=A0A1H5Y093_9BACT|nr:polysaccharide biosynthesis C-terminal domain-containing protein [Bryocella elongata]SEG16956.1 Membrane protein involved in the export of O-antigen and teichoic acid [Bryocella elongata]